MSDDCLLLAATGLLDASQELSKELTDLQSRFSGLKLDSTYEAQLAVLKHAIWQMKMVLEAKK